MRQARYAAPLALVRDRFILALGGISTGNNVIRSCECYDTHTNHWFQTQDMPRACANTCAVVMNQRIVYVMPGSNKDMLVVNGKVATALMIMVLDTGSSQ